ncbi:MAG TPA: radical SAM protein [Nannocystis exedens]|nr:radical SAM protein [Nannocystis exedens]
MESSIHQEDLNSRGAPPLLRWDIVSRCNLSCSHCCVGEMLRDDETIDLDGAQIAEGLRNAARNGVRQVHFLGGEPTIRKDFIDIVRVAREAGLEVSYNTNGIRQDETYLQAILDLDPISITISLDGPDPHSHDAVRGKGTFERTLGFIKRLVAARSERGSKRPEIQIQSVLTASWANRARNLVDLAADLGADSLVINNLAAMGDAIENSEALQVDAATTFKAGQEILSALSLYPNLRVSAPIRLKVIQYYRERSGDRTTPLKENSCPALDENSQVNHDGTITPCQLAQSYGLGQGSDLPSVFDDDLNTIWSSSTFDEFSAKVKGPNDSVYKHQEPCNRCHFLGRGCQPCPLPSDPHYFTTNYQCLIAEGLLAHGHAKGGTDLLSDGEIERVIAEVLERAQPRRRPEHSPHLFEQTPVRRRLPVLS